MLRGLYTSASGMLVETIRTDVVANNLANVETRGFKRQSTSVRSFPEMLIQRVRDPVGPVGAQVDPRPVIGALGTGATVDDLGLEMTPGAVRYTGRALDIALDGPGFLAVETLAGEVVFTRDASLQVGADGYLATSMGLRVLGEDGHIFVGDGSPFIGEDGGVWVDGERVATISVWEFPQPRALERLGENLLAASEGSGLPQAGTATRLMSQHVEASNVNVVQEMVLMIAIQRAYEANQRMVQAQDETLGRLINDAAVLA